MLAPAPFEVITGDCLDVLKGIEAGGVDALLTDPPAGISFMNAAWDSSKGGRDAWVAWMRDVMTECRRVLKPGAHALVWAIPRTSHWTATAIEDAGFSVRDVITHHFGSGFPKSLDIAKAIDRGTVRDRETGDLVFGGFSPDVYAVTAFIRAARDVAGLTNADIDRHFGTDGMAGHWTSLKSQPLVPTWEQWLALKTLLHMSDDLDAEVWRLNGRKGKPGEAFLEREVVGTAVMHDTSRARPGFSGVHSGKPEDAYHEVPITRPKTEAAQQWEGWGTALKPASEHWILARTPLAERNLAANVLRYGTGAINIAGCRVPVPDGVPLCTHGGEAKRHAYGELYSSRRTGQVGESRWPANLVLSHSSSCNGVCAEGCPVAVLEAQSEGASRYFYVAKPSTRERNAGLDGYESQKVNDGRLSSIDNPFQRGETLRQNTHPTVKPMQLMRYLARLITPPGGLILDPFTGSGTTGMAAMFEGFRFVGIEQDVAFAQMARRRIAWALQQAVQEREQPAQPALF